MPVFSQEPIEVKKSGRPKGISQDIVDSYKPYIEKLEKGHKGKLEFKKDENINQGRKALIQAGEELKKYVKVRKIRGVQNVLEFKRITRKEYVEGKRKAAERGRKIASAKAKPKSRARKR